MNLVVVTPPAEEPVSLAEAKAHLRVEIDDDDALIAGLIVAARIQAETLARQTFVATTYDLALDSFGGCGAIVLPRGPLVSVASISYLDAQGVAATLPSGGYVVQAGAVGRVQPPYGVSWPFVRGQLGAVVIRYTAGYGTAETVPQNAKLAILMLVDDWYNHRSGEGEVSPAVRALLAASDGGIYA